MLPFFYTTFAFINNRKTMIEQIKQLLADKIGDELSGRFNLPANMVELAVEKVTEIVADKLGMGQDSGTSGLLSQGMRLLSGGGGDIARQLTDALGSQLPEKLQQTGQFDNTLARNVTSAITPKVTEIAQQFLGGNQEGGKGLMDKLGDLF